LDLEFYEPAEVFPPAFLLRGWHIANANKFGHIRRVNGILGLGNPALVTPLELLAEETTNG